ncbi:hypothetical protein JHK84_055559 [Glycine max]|nr:hypothetical protein JHK86_055518 [Glycine max]KAG4918250.1 hypothetical protein JHK85_056531 [Glycine max]KAG5074328.1 hypothetical protein JHK84_055559 [Glycine max]
MLTSCSVQSPKSGLHMLGIRVTCRVVIRPNSYVCAEVKQISTVATTTTSSGNKIREILGNHNYNKLGLPFNEQKYLANVKVDTILDNALALVLHLIQVLGLLHEGKALEQVVKLVPMQDLMLDGSSSSSYSSSCLREHPPYQEPLDWPTRKRVGLGSARGLSYLHDHCDPKIIHCDVKAANILLGEEFEAVVGSFGLAKLMDYKKRKYEDLIMLTDVSAQLFLYMLVCLFGHLFQNVQCKVIVYKQLTSLLLGRLSNRFKEWGFDKGWGNIARRAKETMKLLYEVVYILDQVRALEEELLHKIELQVLDVKPQILMVSY